MKFVFSHPDYPHIIEGMCQWAGPRIGNSYDPERTTGISVLCEHGCATVLYTDNTPRIDVRMHVAGEGNWLSRTALNVFFSYPFRELEVGRVTALIAKGNAPSRTLVRKLGFKEEGCARKAAFNGDDLVLYGMLKTECKWLKELDNGQEQPVAA